MLESDMAHAFLKGSNADMTATDTQKNLVRTVRMRSPACITRLRFMSSLMFCISAFKGVLRGQTM